MKPLVLTHISKQCQEAQRKSLYVEEISNWSTNGVEFASGVIYAEALGFRLIGKVPHWVLKLRRFPLSTHPYVLSKVRSHLSLVNVELSDQGELTNRVSRAQL